MGKEKNSLENNVPFNGCATVPCHLSHVRFFMTPWTTAHQLLCPWNFPGKSTEVGCHALLQGIFSIQVLNLHLLHLLHRQVGSLPLAPLGSDDERIGLQFRRPRFNPWVRKIPWRRQWLSTSVLFPGEFHGQRSHGQLSKGSDTTE